LQVVVVEVAENCTGEVTVELLDGRLTLTLAITGVATMRAARANFPNRITPKKEFKDALVRRFVPIAHAATVVTLVRQR
jgi:hypothetical protein